MLCGSSVEPQTLLEFPPFGDGDRVGRCSVFTVVRFE